MPMVRFVAPSGDSRDVDIPVGRSVMQGAIAAGIDGIVAECGGELVCATCHVFVLSHGDALPPRSELEDEMLDHTAEARQDNSRLSCRLIVSEAAAGLIVALPKVQT